MTSITRATPLYIVLNVGSGHGDAEVARATIAEVLDGAAQAHEFFSVENADDLPVLARRAVAAAQKKGGAVIAAGGDGTINTVAQAVLDGDVPFGVLPQGTFNYFGRTHSIPTDTRAATQALLNATLRPAQAGLINDRIFLVNASIGLYPRVLEDREAYKQKFGRFRLVALWSGLMTLLRGYPQLRLLLERDGEKIALRTATLFIGNNALQLQQIGIAEAAAQRHGYLIAVTPRPATRWTMLGLILRGVRGTLSEAATVDSFAFKNLRVEMQFKSRQRVKVATDGEIIWLQTPLIIQISSRPLQLMIPADAEKIIEQP